MDSPVQTRPDTERELARCLADVVDLGDQLMRVVTSCGVATAHWYSHKEVGDLMDAWSTARLEAKRALRASR